MKQLSAISFSYQIFQQPPSLSPHHKTKVQDAVSVNICRIVVGFKGLLDFYWSLQVRESVSRTSERVLYLFRMASQKELTLSFDQEQTKRKEAVIFQMIPLTHTFPKQNANSDFFFIVNKEEKAYPGALVSFGFSHITLKYLPEKLKIQWQL